MFIGSFVFKAVGWASDKLRLLYDLWNLIEIRLTLLGEFLALTA